MFSCNGRLSGLLASFTCLYSLGIGLGANPKTDEKSNTVVAEGVGKDEKEARKAAFRDAVSKVVGTIIDAESLVKNDQLISEKILEYSGGFIKSYDTLQSEKTAEGLIRVRIKAIVERTQIVGKLSDAKVTTNEVKGTDLLAEKMTKEEARKNATALLEKLFEDLPKIAKAEVVGKPQLTDDAKGLNVDIRVSADAKAYTDFVKRSTKLLDKVAIQKESVILTCKNNNTGGFILSDPLIDKPKLGQSTTKGYAIWLMTFADGATTRWNLYWVDADISDSLKPLKGEKLVHLEIFDPEGKLITEFELPLPGRTPRTSSLRRTTNEESFLYLQLDRNYVVDKEKRQTISLIIAPFDIDYLYGPPTYFANVSIQKKVLLNDNELERVKTIKASVILKDTAKKR